MTKQISSRRFILTAIIGCVLIMTLVTANTFWASRQTISATDEAVSAVSTFYLEAMADRRARTITNLINNNFDQMEKAVAFFREEGIETQEDLRRVIGRVKNLLALSRFALVDEDNIVYTQYTTYTGGSRHEFLSEEVLPGRIISTVYLYGSSKQLCLAIPTGDLTMMGKRFKACFVQIDIRDIVDLLAFDDEGRTYFALYSKNGGNLSDTELGPVVSGNNLFEVIREALPEETVEEIRRDFEEEWGGNLNFTANGIDETLSYVPIEGTGWEMVVLIRESVIHDQIRGISEKNLAFSRYQIAFAVVLLLLFATLLLLQLRRISSKQLEAEKENSRTFLSMANTDSLTGVRNKHAYIQTEHMINRRIRDGEQGALEVIVCDVNGLKYVNDTQGHAAGDQLIRDASALICESFSHGSVFRTGGDEFAVLLQDKGYETKDADIEAFNRQVEENLQKGAVVVSIGSSTYTPEDKELREVYERADQKMYERKKELKGMGAKTRES